MSSAYGTYLVNTLKADSTLTTILTGGIYIFEDSGRTGLNRIQNLEAFNKKTGLLKPVGVVYEQNQAPTDMANDTRIGFMSTVTPFLVYLYDNGNNGYVSIEAAQQRIYKLLHGQRIPNGFQSLCKNLLTDKREPLLQDASFYCFWLYVYGFRRNP